MDFQSFVEHLHHETSEVLLDFSKSDPTTFLQYAARIDDNEHNDVLKALCYNAYHTLFMNAWKAGEQEKALDFLEQALIAIQSINDPSMEERIDITATALGSMRPGRPQEIMNKTKLRYLGKRIFPLNDNFSLSEEALAPFKDIWLTPNRIVKSAIIFSKVLGDGSSRNIHFLLFEVEKPWEETSGEWKSSFFCDANVAIDGTVSLDYSDSENVSDGKKKRGGVVKKKSYAHLEDTKDNNLQDNEDDVPKLTVTGVKTNLISENLRTKPKVLVEAIKSGKVRDIVDNEFILNTLSWFRVSDARFRIPVYLLWGFILGILFTIISKDFLIPSFMMLSLYAYGIGAVGGPLKWIVDKLQLIPFSWIFIVPLITIPWYFSGWPAEKLYEFIFSKFTCLNMGASYIEKGEYEKARVELENAKVPKDDKEGHLMQYALLGEAYSELGQYDAAINAYAKAVEYDPEDTGLKIDLAYCYIMKGISKEALGLLLNILKSDQENTTAYLGIARCYLIEEKYHQAIKYLQQLLELDENSATGHQMLAEAYMRLGNGSEAIKEAKHALKLNPAPIVAKAAQDIMDSIQNNSAGGTFADDNNKRIDDYSSKLIDQDKKNESDFVADIIETEKKIKEIPTEESVADNMFERMFCSNPNCAKELPGDSVFCGYCGTKLSKTIKDAYNSVSSKGYDDSKYREAETQNVNPSNNEANIEKKGLTDDVKKHIMKIAGDAFKKAGINPKGALQDTAKFNTAVGIAHKLLPLPVRILVKKETLGEFMKEILSQNESVY